MVALDRTFRFHNNICDFTSTFVMNNPAQLKKTIHAVVTTDSPAITLVQHEHEANATAIEYCLEDIQRQGGSVGLLHRPILQLSGPSPRVRRFPGVTFRYDTAHSSKGQEADFVIVLDVNDGRWGWPSQIEDDPLLQLVLPDEDPFLFAEERRLFYVAVTCARHHTYMLSDISAPSVFVQEMLAGHHKDYAFHHLLTEGGQRNRLRRSAVRVATDGSSTSPRHPANSMAVPTFPTARSVRFDASGVVHSRWCAKRAPMSALIRLVGTPNASVHRAKRARYRRENREVRPLPWLLKPARGLCRYTANVPVR